MSGTVRLSRSKPEPILKYWGLRFAIVRLHSFGVTSLEVSFEAQVVLILVEGSGLSHSGGGKQGLASKGVPSFAWLPSLRHMHCINGRMLTTMTNINKESHVE